MELWTLLPSVLEIGCLENKHMLFEDGAISFRNFIVLNISPCFMKMVDVYFFHELTPATVDQ